MRAGVEKAVWVAFLAFPGKGAGNCPMSSSAHGAGQNTSKSVVSPSGVCLRVRWIMRCVQRVGGSVRWVLQHFQRAYLGKYKAGVLG